MKSKSYFSKRKKEEPKPKVKARADKRVELHDKATELLEKVFQPEPKVEQKPAHECMCCKLGCLCCNHLSGTVTDRCTCRCKTEASHKV